MFLLKIQLIYSCNLLSVDFLTWIYSELNILHDSFFHIFSQFLSFLSHIFEKLHLVTISYHISWEFFKKYSICDIGTSFLNLSCKIIFKISYLDSVIHEPSSCKHIQTSALSLLNHTRVCKQTSTVTTTYNTNEDCNWCLFRMTVKCLRF